MISSIYFTSVMLVLVRAFIGLLFGCVLVYFTLHCIDGKVIKKHAVTACILAVVFLSFPGKHEIVTYLVLVKLDHYIQEHEVEMMNPDALTNTSLAIEKAISDLEKDSKRILGGR